MFKLIPLLFLSFLISCSVSEEMITSVVKKINVPWFLLERNIADRNKIGSQIIKISCVDLSMATLSASKINQLKTNAWSV